jgi:predicted membrane-bound mannosyltransferase
MSAAEQADAFVALVAVLVPLTIWLFWEELERRM